MSRPTALSLLAVPVVALLLGGDGGCSSRESTFTAVGSAVKPSGAPAGRSDREAAGEAAPAGGGKPADAAPVERKIIYNGSIEVVVKELDVARKEVERIVEEHKGYVSKSDVTGDTGTRRTATWTLKVPVDQFRPVLTALAALGHPVRNSSDSQDVTEEYVDLQARVKNLKVEEETLNKLLKESVVKIEDILKIRDQIKNVRGEIERAEGRMKYLSTMAAMSTVTMTAREDLTYVPPAPETAPTFGDEIEGTFTRSVTALKNTGQQLTLVIVARCV